MAKILWVDDEVELLKPHIFFLQNKGYEVDTCNNGYDAIDMVRTTAYDLIILDEMMPGMTGLETLPLIKDVRPTTPVIMVTKSEEEHLMDKAIGSKIADYIIKPVNPNQVLLSIKKNVHSQQLVTEQTTADYRAEFGRISAMCQGADSFEAWCTLYRKITGWEIELSATADPSIREVLSYQKSEANQEFCKFVRRNYYNWINKRVEESEIPILSHTLMRKKILPVVDENSIRAQVLAEQKARVNGINDLFAMFGGRYQTLQAQCLADPECSLEQAREKLLNEMGRESTPSNKNTPAHIYAGNGNFVGDGIRQALMARAGFEKTERDNVYNGMTLREYARMSLTERGIGVSGYNPMQMVGAAFTHSTSDFGNILLDVANKAILQGWEDAPETYEQWTRKGQLSDFKIAHRVGMGGFSALRQVREGAEYKYVTTGDKQATIALATYGELFSITRQAIINDDLNMLTDVPMKLGRAAKSTIADLVYAILTSNPKISTDNVSLFDKAKHANVLESAAMDVASLDKARQLMRVQKEGERHLNIRPAFVLVPTAMESVANQVIRSSSVKGADINAGIINPVKDFATVIAEPRLDDNSHTTLYLAASKGSDTIEVAYLNGVDTPYIDQMEGFSVDGVTTKVRIDAGVAPVDHRGLVKCTA